MDIFNCLISIGYKEEKNGPVPEKLPPNKNWPKGKKIAIPG
jgi:hypothetical protein